MTSRSLKLNHQSRFEALWARNSISAVNGTEIANTLLERYSEADRHYHTIEHIEFCLSLFDQVADQCVNSDAVELAIWFHDAIYNFPLVENEKLSADYFMDASEGYMADDLRQNIFRQVITTDHKVRPVDPDQQILVDIDLSSFGRPWDQFIKDGQNVRRELAYQDDGFFYQQQISFMKQLVARKDFYNTPWFQQQFEATARSNLSRYLESLSQKGYDV